jgi:hypothetical protein
MSEPQWQPRDTATGGYRAEREYCAGDHGKPAAEAARQADAPFTAHTRVYLPRRPGRRLDTKHIDIVRRQGWTTG